MHIESKITSFQIDVKNWGFWKIANSRDFIFKKWFKLTLFLKSKKKYSKQRLLYFEVIFFSIKAHIIFWFTKLFDAQVFNISIKWNIISMNKDKYSPLLSYRWSWYKRLQLLIINY